MTKRIALIGNMNNNMFALCRYLRDAGHDAHVFYRPVFDHFTPKADTYELGYMSYCHPVSWLDEGFHAAPFDQVRQALSSFDVVMGQGDEAAVASRAGFTFHIYFPYGSDLYKYSRLPKEFTLLQQGVALARGRRSRVSAAKMREGTQAKFLAAAIASARHVMMDYAEMEPFYRELRPAGSLERLTTPFIYAPEYRCVREGTSADVHWKSHIDQLRASHELIVLYHGRQEWKTRWNDFTGKNTHHVILGFAEFVKAHPDARAALIMLEYGTDVVPSKELIASVGLTERVHWFPLMYRKDLMYLIRRADLCCGEFDQSFLTYGTVIEALLMGRAVMSYREDDRYAGRYPELFPIANVREPEQIADAIASCYVNPERFEEMGEIGRRWAEKYVLEQPVSRILQLVDDAPTRS